MDKSNWIKTLRASTGLSQAQFAAENHIPVITLQSWERGVRSPKMERLLELSKKYDIPLNI